MKKNKSLGAMIALSGRRMELKMPLKLSLKEKNAIKRDPTRHLLNKLQDLDK